MFTAQFISTVCVPIDGNCGASGDNLTWELSCEGVLTITGSGAMANYADEASVPWYAHRGAVVSLSLPAGITTIGSYAFCATNVREVSLPEGVTTLGANAFMQCQSLRTLELPTTLTSIGANALAYCGALELPLRSPAIATRRYMFPALHWRPTRLHRFGWTWIRSIRRPLLLSPIRLHRVILLRVQLAHQV